MSDTKSLGPKGEEIAAGYLKQKGYSIRNRNWVSGKNEIDIIAENNEYVVFVEVKTRSENPLVELNKSVPPSKQKIIEYMAERYIKRYNINKQGRFDVILIEMEGSGFKIDHIEDAFYSTLR